METTDKIKVESYQKITPLGGWPGGGRTLWARAALSTVIGAGLGVIAPFFPLIVGASSVATAVSAIPTSVLAFAATGLSGGFTGGLVLGRITGAAAAAAEENERRMKEWTARQLLHNDPNSNIAPDPVKEKAPKKPFWRRVSDSYHTYVNPRIGLTMAAIGAIGGLIMGGAFLATTGGVGAFAIMPALATLTGLSAEAAAAPAVVLAYTTGISAAIGALWTFNVPKIASAVTEFTGNLIAGKYIGRPWAPKPEKQKTQAATPKEQIPADEIAKNTSFAGNLTRPGSFQDLIASQATESATEALIKR